VVTYNNEILKEPQEKKRKLAGKGVAEQDSETDVSAPESVTTNGTEKQKQASKPLTMQNLTDEEFANNVAAIAKKACTKLERFPEASQTITNFTSEFIARIKSGVKNSTTLRTQENHTAEAQSQAFEKGLQALERESNWQDDSSVHQLCSSLSQEKLPETTSVDIQKKAEELLFDTDCIMKTSRKLEGVYDTADNLLKQVAEKMHVEEVGEGFVLQTTDVHM